MVNLSISDIFYRAFDDVLQELGLEEANPEGSAFDRRPQSEACAAQANTAWPRPEVV